MLIHERSGGIPRTVSVMCDNALLTGFGLGRQPVNYDTVLEVANDLDLHEKRSRELPSSAEDEPAQAPEAGPSDPVAFRATQPARDGRSAPAQPQRPSSARCCPRRRRGLDSPFLVVAEV